MINKEMKTVAIKGELERIRIIKADLKQTLEMAVISEDWETAYKLSPMVTELEEREAELKDMLFTVFAE